MNNCSPKSKNIQRMHPAAEWRHRLTLVNFLTILLTLSAGLPATGWAESPAMDIVFHFKPVVKLNSTEIRLSDIADIATADPQIKSALGRIWIDQSPRPGRSKTLFGPHIQMVLAETPGFSIKQLATPPARIRIVRLSQTVPFEALKTQFKAHIASILEAAAFEISQFKVKNAQRLPLGQLDFIFPKRFPQDLKGRIHCKVTVMLDGREYTNLQVSAWIHRYENVLSLKHTLPRGTIIAATDLADTRIDISKDRIGYIKDASRAIGWRTRRQLRSGICLKAAMIEKAPLISKGDTVKIIAKSGTLKVVAIGVALSDGMADGRIQVENIASQKTIIGTVQDNGTVEVLF